MKQRTKTFFLTMLLGLFLAFLLCGCTDSLSSESSTSTDANPSLSADESTVYENITGDSYKDYSITSDDFDPEAAGQELDEDGSYTTVEDVVSYLVTYDTLPDNFITKKEAKKLGWTGGSLEPYAPGKCIGGDYFGNYEGILPDDDGQTYHECDIDTLGENKRGSKRIVYSDDGDIYYTEDHYETFTLVYDEE